MMNMDDVTSKKKEIPNTALNVNYKSLPKYKI